MSAPRSLSGAKRTLRKLHSTRASHKYSPSQLSYPPADSLPRERFSGVLDMFSNLEVKVLYPT
jgi:hypothetical protein